MRIIFRQYVWLITLAPRMSSTSLSSSYLTSLLLPDVLRHLISTAPQSDCDSAGPSISLRLIKCNFFPPYSPSPAHLASLPQLWHLSYSLFLYFFIYFFNVERERHLPLLQANLFLRPLFTGTGHLLALSLAPPRCGFPPVALCIADIAPVTASAAILAMRNSSCPVWLVSVYQSARSLRQFVERIAFCACCANMFSSVVGFTEGQDSPTPFGCQHGTAKFNWLIFMPKQLAYILHLAFSNQLRFRESQYLLFLGLIFRSHSCRATFSSSNTLLAS